MSSHPPQAPRCAPSRLGSEGDFCLPERVVGETDRRAARYSPWRIMLTIIACTFLAEVLVMLVLSQMKINSAVGEAVVGAGMLAALIAPALYFIVFRPLLALIQANRRSKENFRAIVDKSDDGILLVSQSGIVRFANPAATRLLNRKHEELLCEQFGLPLSKDKPVEVDLVTGIGTAVTAEMRVLNTRWQGEDCFLVTLRDVTGNANLREQLRAQSLTDELTGLHNRRGFFTLGERPFKMAQRGQPHVQLCFVDLDGIKSINDTHGHEQGDLALKDAADLLRQTFRETDIIARLGGDEFAVLCLSPASATEETPPFDRLQENVTAFNNASHRPYELSFSMGTVEHTPGEPTSLNDLLARADERMYQHKLGKRTTRDQRETRPPGNALAHSRD